MGEGTECSEISFWSLEKIQIKHCIWEQVLLNLTTLFLCNLRASTQSYPLLFREGGLFLLFIFSETKKKKYTAVFPTAMFIAGQRNQMEGSTFRARPINHGNNSTGQLRHKCWQRKEFSGFNLYLLQVIKTFIYSNRSFLIYISVPLSWLRADLWFEEQVNLTRKQIAS